MDLAPGKKLLQGGSRTAKLAGNVNEVSRAGPGAQNGFACGNLADDDNVSRDLIRSGYVAAGELHAVALCQAAKTLEKFVRPALRKLSGKGEGEETGKRLASHGGNVAEAASQAAVADAAGRVPVAAEVDVFNRQISGDEELVAAGRAEDGTVVADSVDHGAIAALEGNAPDALNQRFFGGNQGEFKYSEKKGLAGLFPPVIEVCSK
jgi:hypothetical protein